MIVSPQEVATLLSGWGDTGKSVSVSFLDASGNTGWRRVGKVIAVHHTTFEISWDDGDIQEFPYLREAVSIAEDGRSLYLVNSSGERFVVAEPSSI